MSADSISEIIDDLQFAYNSGNNLEFNIHINSKVIIFSDHHRGNGGGNDDFRHCKDAYKKALEYYLDNNYRLILLGDVEELWENFKFSRIYKKYAEIYSLEKEFFKKNTGTDYYYIRCFGNHDYRYAYKEYVRDDLENVAKLKDIQVYEGIKMHISGLNSDKHIYLSHGHQGHYPRNEDTIVHIEIVAFGLFQSTIPFATNKSLMNEPPLLKEMRRLTNGGYLIFGHKMKIPVIYGHTHEAIFKSQKIFNGQFIEVQEKDYTNVTSINAFNTGCCSFGDGAITGIEINQGALRLVKWTSDEHDQLPITVRNKNNEISEISLEALFNNV